MRLGISLTFLFCLEVCLLLLPWSLAEREAGQYQHDPAGDTALPYKHDPAGDVALPYKHDPSGDKAQPYKHDKRANYKHDPSGEDASCHRPL